MKFPRPERVEGVAERLVPLRPLLAQQPQDKLDEAIRRAANLERADLLMRFRTAFADRNRVRAFVFAEALIKQGIPPYFWQDTTPEHMTLEQRFDLFLYDVRWLRRTYLDHTKNVRYKRSRQLLSFNETDHHREAEWAFYNGQRRAWQLVQTLSLTERQQWDCAWLRSAPITKRHHANQMEGPKVIQMLKDDLQAIPRTATFTEQDAERTVIRRHALWLCSRTTGGGPTEIAARYHQMTGSEITRQAAAKQLGKLSEILKRKTS